MNNGPNTPENRLGPLLPWFVGVVAVSLLCDIAWGYSPDSFWVLLLTSMVLLYARSAFVYLAWSEKAEQTEIPRPRRFLAHSRTLFGHTLIVSIALGVPSYGLGLILTQLLNPLPFLLSQAAKDAVVLAVTGWFMASTAGKDFLTGIMGMGRVGKHGFGLILLLGLCGEPFALACLYLLLLWTPTGIPVMGLVLDIIRNCFLVYLLWKLVLIRARLDKREEAPSSAQSVSSTAEADHDQVD